MNREREACCRVNNGRRVISSREQVSYVHQVSVRCGPKDDDSWHGYENEPNIAAQAS